MENMQETNKYTGDEFLLRLAEMVAFEILWEAAKWLFSSGLLF